MVIYKTIVSFAKKMIPQRCRESIRFFCKFYGFRYKCPCCGGHFRQFAPYGTKVRQNARCPRCGTLERHRLLWLYLKNKTVFFKKTLKVLHIAPEPYLQDTFKRLRNLDYITADLHESDVDLKIDVTDITLDDDQFDCIICYHVLEHIVDDRKAMKELYRILKPGGFAIIQVPIDERRARTFENPAIVRPEEIERYFGQIGHVRMYGRDYKDRLEDAGFTVQVDNYVKKLGKRRIDRYLLDKYENIYLCLKDL